MSDRARVLGEWTGENGIRWYDADNTDLAINELENRLDAVGADGRCRSCGSASRPIRLWVHNAAYQGERLAWVGSHQPCPDDDYHQAGNS